MARSARYSWKKPSSVNSTTIAPIAPASRNLPSISDNSAAPIRINTITADTCCQTIFNGCVEPLSISSFDPTSSNRCAASSVDKPPAVDP
jgi:hypothetical protein